MNRVEAVEAARRRLKAKGKDHVLPVSSRESADRLVRFYTSRGLVDRPGRVDRKAHLDDHHVDQIVAVRILQDQGFSLKEIGEVLRRTSPGEVRSLGAGDVPLTIRAVRALTVKGVAVTDAWRTLAEADASELRATAEGRTPENVLAGARTKEPDGQSEVAKAAGGGGVEVAVGLQIRLGDVSVFVPSSPGVAGSDRGEALEPIDAALKNLVGVGLSNGLAGLPQLGGNGGRRSQSMQGPLVACSMGSLYEDAAFVPGTWPMVRMTFSGEGLFFPDSQRESAFEDVGELELTLLAASDTEREEARKRLKLDEIEDVHAFWLAVRRAGHPLRWDASVELLDDEGIALGTWSGSAMGVAESRGVAAKYLGYGRLVLPAPERLGLPGGPPLRLTTILEDHIDMGNYHWRLAEWHFDHWPVAPRDVS